MFGVPTDDPHDPVRLTLRRYWRNFRNACFVLIVVAVGIWLRGVPHVRVSEPAYSQGSFYAPATARYVSLNGFTTLYSGQHGEGLPLVVFVPISDVL